MPLWQWGIVLIVLFFAVRWLLNRWMAARFGVQASPPMLERAQVFMAGIQHADRLITDGELGQALHVLNELAQRPERTEMPILAAQVDLNIARVASALGRFDTALPPGARAVEFYREVYRKLRTVTNASNLGEALQIVARIHLQKEDLSKAKVAFQEIRALNRRGAFRQTAVRTEIELAKLHISLDEFDQAVVHAKEGYTLATKWKMTDHAVEALNIQAMAVGAAGDLVGCRRLLDVAAAEMRPDAPAALRAHHFVVREGLAADHGDLQEQLATGSQLLETVAELKAGRGWRHDQAVVLATFADAERRTLEAAVTLALRQDINATTAFTEILGLLRESEIAHLLRSGLLDAGSDAREGLPGVVADLLLQLAQVEDPNSQTSGSAAALYEQLEAAASARFRQLVQAPSRRRKTKAGRRHHLIQIRMVDEDSGGLVLYGSWEAPNRSPVPYRTTLPLHLADTLRDVTGMTDRTHPPSSTKAPTPVRASTKNWSSSRQFQALSQNEDRWRTLTSWLLPPTLLDLISATRPNAHDDEIPLIVFSPDSHLWGLPWAALQIDGDGTTLGDRAATALLPSHSLLQTSDASQPSGSRVLSYLHGVDEAGLELERTSLKACWPGLVDEAADAATLVQALTTANKYSMLTMSVHGDNRPGLAHSLHLNPAKKTRLSAARMMGLNFPRTVVVGACFSGALDNRIGTDPIGIPSVMLCRGASTVIGGTFPLADGPATNHATATILHHFYALHARGVPAPWALRGAQQRWRAEHNTTPVTWAGLTAMTNGNF